MIEDGMLFGYSKAENLTVLTNGMDRLERFSIRDESSDDLKLVGFRVLLKPTYLAELEFIKVNNEMAVASL